MAADARGRVHYRFYSLELTLTAADGFQFNIQHTEYASSKANAALHAGLKYGEYMSPDMSMDIASIGVMTLHQMMNMYAGIKPEETGE